MILFPQFLSHGCAFIASSADPHLERYMKTAVGLERISFPESSWMFCIISHGSIFTTIQNHPLSPAQWFLILRRLHFKVWLSCLILDFLSQQAWGALREPAVISVSASPVWVNHPFQNGSLGFHGNLLSHLHKGVHRDCLCQIDN